MKAERKWIRLIVLQSAPPDLRVNGRPVSPGDIIEVGPLEVAAFEGRGYRKAEPPMTNETESSDAWN